MARPYRLSLVNITKVLVRLHKVVPQEQKIGISDLENMKHFVCPHLNHQHFTAAI